MERFFEVIDNLINLLGEKMCRWISYLDKTEIGLNIAVRIVMACVSLLLLYLLLQRMLKSQIKESVFLMWSLPAALLFVYGVWPEITYFVADMTHMAYGYALVVTVPFIALLYYIAFRYMCQISELMSKVTELGSLVSIQKHEISELKKRISSLEASENQPEKQDVQDENRQASEKSDDTIEVVIN